MNKTIHLKLTDKFKKYLRAKNRAFKKLSLKEQRVKIAQDVLEQLASSKIIASSMYFSPENVEITDRVEQSNLDVSEITCQVQCRVCGIGSLFLTAVENANNLKFKNFWKDVSREAEVRYLGKWFSAAQLTLVEDYFEHYFEGDLNERLRMIMENIISNKGRFNPKKGAHAAVIS